MALAQIAPARVVGQYALGLAIAAPLNVFADRALRTLQATAADDDFPLREYLALRTLVGVAAMAISALIVSIGSGGKETLQIVLLVAAARVIEGISQTFYGRLQRHQQMQRIGQSQVMRSLLATAASLAGLYIWRRLDVALLAGIVASAFVVWKFDLRPYVPLAIPSVRQAPRLTIAQRSLLWAGLLRMAMPLAVSTFLVSLSGNLPRIFLSRLENEGALGVFAVLCQLCLPATIVVSAVMQVAIPRMVETYRRDPVRGYPRLLRRLTVVCAAVAAANALVVYALGPYVLRRMLSDEYIAAGVHLDLLAAAFGVGFVAVVPGTALTAQRWFGQSLWVCCGSCTVAFIASSTLIPRLGMGGAAGAMLLANAVHGVACWCVLRMAGPEPAASTDSTDRARDGQMTSGRVGTRTAAAPCGRAA
jgi:O-antigen/teichoic acid export membrane protein